MSSQSEEVSSMKVKFQTVDVFTDRQFGGNPVAVIPDARGLSDAEMQAIANEFNLSETTFVLPPADPANTARVRIFTPRAEMPFAGHPNVGTAFVLAHQDAVCGVSFDRRNMIFEEIAGLVRMRIDSVDGRVMGASLAAPQQFRVVRNFDVAMIAQACSLDPSDIEVRRHRPCLASCGARRSLLPKCGTEPRCGEPSSAWMSSFHTCRETRSPAFICMSRTQKRASTFNRGCLRRCMASLKTPRPGAQMSRWLDSLPICDPSRHCDWRSR